MSANRVNQGSPGEEPYSPSSNNKAGEGQHCQHAELSGKASIGIDFLVLREQSQKFGQIPPERRELPFLRQSFVHFVYHLEADYICSNRTHDAANESHSSDDDMGCHQSILMQSVLGATLPISVYQDLKNDTLRHMYGLKKEIDLSFLRGREVIQIAIGIYQTQFGFDEDVRISVGGGFCHFDGQNDSVWKPEPGFEQIAARTVALLGARVETFEAREDGTLTLNSSNGHRLVIPDSSKEYESYDITRPGQIIIV